MAELPEGYGGGGSHVEGIDAAAHGDDDLVVAALDGAVGEAVAFGAHHDDEAFLGHELRVVDRHGVGPEGHGGSLEAHVVEAFHGGVRPGGEVGPGYLEDGAHAHTDAAAVEGVAAGGGEEHSIDAQGGGGAEDGARVGAVHHAIDEHHAAGVTACLFDISGLGSLHGTEHAAGELIACEGGQQLAAACVDGYVATTLYDVGRLSYEVFLFGKEREGLAARIEGHTNDFGALADEDAFVGFEAVAELCLGEAAIDLQVGVGEVGEVYEGHVFF